MQSPVLYLIACSMLPTSLVLGVEASISPILPMPVGLVVREFSPASIIEKLEAVGHFEVTEAAPQVATYSVHASPDVRLSAVRTLGRIGRKVDVTKPLIAALADVDFRVQSEAVKALGAVKAKAALPQLIALAGITRNEDFRRELLKAVTAITVD